LIGEPQNDIVAVAQAQLNRTQSQMGYTEAWCANFVCDCAKLIGQSSAIPSNGSVPYLYNAILAAGGQQVYSRQKGDIIFYNCSACDTNGDGLALMHVGIVWDETYSIEGNYNGKVARVSSYTDQNKHTTTSGTVKRIYLRPNYSGGTSHTVNSSYGTNFTAYPKEKITASNIFDAGHNQISSTAWIGTSDKCTIHEVYTDGCCRVSYPLDDGGSKTVYSKISLFNTSHTCNKGEYVYYEAAHPHYKCYRCSICGVVWRNTSEPVIVPSCSSCTHTHSYSSSITKQPTCTATGIRTYKCSCGKSYTETISALGHDYSGDRLQEAAHPHQISQRCVRYSTCGGFYWTGENGYSSNCESCKKKSTKIYLWTSNTKMGDSGQTIRTGDWIYLCYKIYDENSGAMFDTYNTNGYTVKLTLYEVDGSVAHTATYSSDDSYIGIQRYTEGKYRGELVFTFNNGGTTTITVYQNLIYEPRVTPSVNDIYLNVAGTNSQTIDISYSGATKSDSIYVDCTTTGDCFNYSWGSWNNHKMPLTVTGIKAGNGTITVRLRDYDTKEILATAKVRVTVKAPTYVVNYDANGGTGAPSSQIKYHNVTLTLSDIKPQRKGYTFLGWSTNSNATSASYQPKGSFTSNSDTTLRAVWKKGCENNSHNYNYKVATAPTTSATGSLIGICSLCQSTTNVTLPKLSTSYYDYSVIKSATCTTSGTGRYVLDTSSYGCFYFDVTISANKHSYGSWAYKDSGYHIHYCTDCGAWEKSLHTYSNKCDSECNICGGTRIPSDHVYDNGSDEFCNVCGAQRKLHIAGDTNGDGKISGKDYALLLQSINGWDVTINNDAADVTSDGKINGKDYAMLLQYINGWDVVLK